MPLARAVLRRLFMAILAAALCYGLTLWTLNVLGTLEPKRLGDSPLFEYANLLTFGVPSLDALFSSSDLLPLGAAYPLVLYALVLSLPQRRRIRWWLTAWLIGASSALMGSLALAFASLEFRDMVQSGAFSTANLFGIWWRLGEAALTLTLRSGTLLLGFPIAIFLLERSLYPFRNHPRAQNAPVQDVGSLEQNPKSPEEIRSSEQAQSSKSFTDN